LRAGLPGPTAWICRIAAGFVDVRIESPKRAEENLTLHGDTGRFPDSDQLRDLLQLISELRYWECGGITGRRNNRLRLIQRSVSGECLIGCISRGLDQRDILIETEQRFVAAAAVVWIRRGRSAPAKHQQVRERGRRGRYRQLPRVNAGCKKARACERNIHWQRYGAIQGVRLVGDSSAPAGLTDGVCHAGLLLGDLI